jgi:predicted NBD/HSP70 family sugar kinase
MKPDIVKYTDGSAVNIPPLNHYFQGFHNSANGKIGLTEEKLPLNRPRPLSDSILKIIWRKKTISRAEIARLTGLARSTVSEAIGKLLKSDLISEIGTGASGGGRQPIILEFQDKANCILGVEIGAAHVAVTLTDLRGRVLAWVEEAFPVRDNPAGTRALVVQLCDICLDQGKGDKSRLLGIGVAVPSPVDPQNPDWMSEVIIPAWKGSIGLEVLKEKYNRPLFIDNDANLGALAEYWWGSGRGIDDFIYIKAATGIGAGYLLDGHIYRGGSGFAGEIGHLSIDSKGGPCICGLNGCLTTFVSAEALIRRAEHLMKEFPDSPLKSMQVTLNSIEDAALLDDELATQIVHEAAASFGIAIAGLLNILNPKAVILGGSLSRLEERLLIPLTDAVYSRTNISTRTATDIRVGALGQKSVAIGATTLVLQAALVEPQLFPSVRNG